MLILVTRSAGTLVTELAAVRCELCEASVIVSYFRRASSLATLMRTWLLSNPGGQRGVQGFNLLRIVWYVVSTLGLFGTG